MPTAHLNGIDVYYERTGSGPRLLFLNGSGATIEGMRVLLGVFDDRFDLAVHDQRGLGRTEIPAGQYEMADYAADAAAFLDHLGWETARVVGVSFGGMVAQELAVTWPGRIERLALVCTSPGGDLASYPLHELARRSESDRAEIGTRILDTRFDEAWFTDHSSDRALAEMMSARRSATKSAEQLRGEMAQLDARSRHDVLDRLHRIACPTLVACGRYDGIAPLANGEAIAASISGADLRIYEGGHAFFAQDRSALPDIVAFLEAATP